VRSVLDLAQLGGRLWISDSRHQIPKRRQQFLTQPLAVCANALYKCVKAALVNDVNDYGCRITGSKIKQTNVVGFWKRWLALIRQVVLEERSVEQHDGREKLYRRWSSAEPFHKTSCCGVRRVGQLRVPRDAKVLIDRTDRHLWVAEVRIATGRLVGGPSQC